MCSLHLTHPSVHTWSSGQPTVQRPGSSCGLPVGAGIRTHNLGLPRVSSPTLYPLGQRLPDCLFRRGNKRGFESRLRQELSTTEVRPLSKAPNNHLLPRRSSVGCPLLQVCVHLDGLNAENTFHCWLYSV